MNFDTEKYIDAIYSNLEEENIHNTDYQNTLVIGDVHFGIKSNSLVWLANQLEFFKLQVIPIIQNANKLNIDSIIFLGDLFDVRYSTNTYIGCEVKNLFRTINKVCKDSNVYCYVIAGNHDFYSPSEEFKYYNIYELIFGDEFTEHNSYIKFITDSPINIYKKHSDDILGYNILLPWYQTENKENLKNTFNEILNNQNHNKVNAIYAHWDLENNCDHETHQFLKQNNIAVYSGHIHYIWTDENYKLYNIGACCQFTFGDANQDRYIYIINEDKNKQIAIKNIITPKFIILYNDDIFNDNIINTFNDNTYVEIRILSKYKDTAKYKERIKYIKSTYIGTSIKLSIISDDNIFENNNNSNIIQSNVEQYIEENTPDELKSNLDIIVDKLKDKN